MVLSYRLSEQDKLLEDDEDLGDFSMVQRETEILRSVCYMMCIFILAHMFTLHFYDM